MYYTINWIAVRRYYDSLDQIVNDLVLYFLPYERWPRIYYAESCQRVEDYKINEAVMRCHKQYRIRIHQRIYGGCHNYEFRHGPVPGIRKRRRGGPYQTAPRTKQERSNPYPTRDKRNLKLPTDWDEYYNRHTERNWKSQRKTQWK